MKKALIFPVILTIVLGTGFSAITYAADSYSLKDIKKVLKKDSSAAANAELAKDILRKGVGFVYTQKREARMKKWGASDVVLSAIWQSKVDESQEKLLFGRFDDKYSSDDKDIRREAFEDGKNYLTQFGAHPRFTENTGKVRKEMEFLGCEFDSSLGC